jgi:hypothetical protein
MWLHWMMRLVDEIANVVIIKVSNTLLHFGGTRGIGDDQKVSIV